MGRGSLLIIAERAIELMSKTQLSALLSDFMQLTAYPAETGRVSASLLSEARTFYDAAMGGNYYEIVEINNGGRQEQSRGTDAFIAEFHRLLHMCIRTANPEVPSGLHESFEYLLGLLRHINEGDDDALFFADDGSSLDVGVNWRIALLAFFNCLAKTASPKDFARTVDEAIADFVNYDRPWYWDMAGNVANNEQTIALDALMT